MFASRTLDDCKPLHIALNLRSKRHRRHTRPRFQINRPTHPAAYAGCSLTSRSGRVFGLSDRQNARRIASAAKAAGLGEGYSGHSGRVDMARRMVKNDAPAAAVMRQGRWATVRMVAAYTRNESAAEALRYLSGGARKARLLSPAGISQYEGPLETAHPDR